MPMETILNGINTNLFRKGKQMYALGQLDSCVYITFIMEMNRQYYFFKVQETL